MHVRQSWPAALLTGTLALTGCAGDDVGAAAPAPPSAAPGTPGATPTAPAPPAGPSYAVTLSGGRVSGDSGRVTAGLGDTVTIAVTSDVADQVHLHGYDVSAEVVPGTPATLTFQATIPGVFAVELEELGKQLLSVQVS